MSVSECDSAVHATNSRCGFLCKQATGAKKLSGYLVTSLPFGSGIRQRKFATVQQSVACKANFCFFNAKVQKKTNAEKS
jgi:hypothetical protein